MNIIKYRGYKNLSIKAIEKYIGTFDKYCEPFSGSFYTGFNTMDYYGDSIKYIYNDIDISLYNFWLCMKNNIFNVIDCINKASDEIKQYYELDEQLHILNKYEFSDNMYERAAAEYIIINTDKFDKHNTNIDNIKRINAETAIEYMSKLELLDLNNTDFSSIIASEDSENTLFLLDPPYYTESINTYYRIKCSYIYHKGMADVVKNIKGKFIITYNIDDYIKQLYKDFYQYELNRTQYKKDLYITNFEITDKSDFYAFCKTIHY